MQTNETYLGDAGAAEYLGLSVRSLQKLRSEGGGPSYMRLGLRRIAYTVAELDRWKASRTFTSRAHEMVCKAA